MSDETPETAAEQPRSVVATTPDPSVRASSAAPVTPASSEPVYDLVEVAPVAASATEPVIPSTNPAAAEVAPTEKVYVNTDRADAQVAPVATAATPQTIYVPAPVPPKNRSNRGFGVLIALISTVIFAGLYAVLLALILASENGRFAFDFVSSIEFFLPVIFFAVGFIVVALIVNRGAWWGYVFGSLFVALFVYFGTIGAGLLAVNVFAETAAEASKLFVRALTNPFVIAGALLAREVSLWMGAAISARGRRVKAKNLEATTAFDQESAARRAEYENSVYRAPSASV